MVKRAVFGRAELAKNASSLGYLWLWAALRSLEEPFSHSASPQKLSCRRQAVPKSLIFTAFDHTGHATTVVKDDELDTEMVSLYADVYAAGPPHRTYGIHVVSPHVPYRA